MRIPNFERAACLSRIAASNHSEFPSVPRGGLHTLSNRLFGGHAVIWRGSRYFKPDKLAETILTVPRGVNIRYENLDHPLNYLYLRKACPVGAARN